MKNKISGSLLFLIGLIFFLLSFSYSIGSISLMGPGYFPMIVSVILMICGIITIIVKND